MNSSIRFPLRIIAVLLLFLSATTVQADTLSRYLPNSASQTHKSAPRLFLSKAKADSFYSAHHYDEALRIYTALLKHHPEDATLLYNQGNCYYRLKDMPHAILSYERAARLNPSDADNRHNLTLARAQTEDKFYSSADLDIAWSFRSFLNTFGIDGWAWLSVFALIGMFAAVLWLRFSMSARMRKGAFALLIVMGAGVVVFNIFALVQHQKLNDHSAAIVMNTTPLLSTPDTTGKTVFTLHGGTKLSLRDTTLPAWTEVSLSDGRKGWVQNKDIANI